MDKDNFLHDFLWGASTSAYQVEGAALTNGKKASHIYMRYNKPLMITENGLGAYDTLTEDGQIHASYRIDYLRNHVKSMKKAMLL